MTIRAASCLLANLEAAPRFTVVTDAAVVRPKSTTLPVKGAQGLVLNIFIFLIQSIFALYIGLIRLRIPLF